MIRTLRYYSQNFVVIKAILPILPVVILLIDLFGTKMFENTGSFFMGIMSGILAAPVAMEIQKTNRSQMLCLLSLPENRKVLALGKLLNSYLVILSLGLAFVIFAFIKWIVSAFFPDIITGSEYYVLSSVLQNMLLYVSIINLFYMVWGLLEKQVILKWLITLVLYLAGVGGSYLLASEFGSWQKSFEIYAITLQYALLFLALVVTGYGAYRIILRQFSMGYAGS